MKKTVLLVALIVFTAWTSSWAGEFKGRVVKLESIPAHCVTCDSATIIHFDDGKQITLKGIVWGIVEIGKVHRVTFNDLDARLTGLIPVD